MSKGDINGASELGVDGVQRKVDLSKEGLGNRVLDAQKVVEGLGVRLNRMDDVPNVVLGVKDRVDYRFLAM